MKLRSRSHTEFANVLTLSIEQNALTVHISLKLRRISGDVVGSMMWKGYSMNMRKRGASSF